METCYTKRLNEAENSVVYKSLFTYLDLKTDKISIIEEDHQKKHIQFIYGVSNELLEKYISEFGVQLHRTSYAYTKQK